MKTNRITRTKKVQIIELRDEGYTHQYIADYIGCNRNSVGRILRLEGMT